jgi:hypothetical protein
MVRDADVPDEFGAIGAHGALATPESLWSKMLSAQGPEYVFPAGAITNLDGAAFIRSHYDVLTAEMGKVLVAAINASAVPAAPVVPPEGDMSEAA